jgi:hypothetical protein
LEDRHHSKTVPAVAKPADFNRPAISWSTTSTGIPGNSAARLKNIAAEDRNGVINAV